MKLYVLVITYMSCIDCNSLTLYTLDNWIWVYKRAFLPFYPKVRKSDSDRNGKWRDFWRFLISSAPVPEVLKGDFASAFEFQGLHNCSQAMQICQCDPTAPIGFNESIFPWEKRIIPLNREYSNAHFPSLPVTDFFHITSKYFLCLWMDCPHENVSVLVNNLPCNHNLWSFANNFELCN